MGKIHPVDAYGLSLRKIGKEIDISTTTAFAWRHKVIEVIKDYQEDDLLSGEIEMDETYFLLKYSISNRVSMTISDIYNRPFPIDIFKPYQHLSLTQVFLAKSTRLLYD